MLHEDSVGHRDKVLQHCPSTLQLVSVGHEP